MKTARVISNRTCNLSCTFCNARSPTDDHEFVRFSAVERRLGEALASGASELVLSGGEPGLRRDLARVVRRARELGASEVVLETNATLVTAQGARELVAAGLDAVRVHVPAWGASFDEITRDAGSFERLCQGLAALVAASATIEIAIPVVRRNLEIVASIPDGLGRAGVSPRTIVIGVPVEAPDASELAGLSAAARAVAAVESSARRLGIPVRLDPGSSIPPCLFPRPDRVAHLFSLNRGAAQRDAHQRVAVCSGCSVQDRCPGIPRASLAREPDLSPRPIESDRLRRRLSLVSSVREQIERELVTHEVERAPDGSARDSYTVRVNFQCNQACGFCFVSTHLPSAADAAVRNAIVEGASTGAALVLSGGEPTLNAALADYVRLAKRSGAASVELQTNATRLEDRELLASLEDAGVDVAFVSLHGSNAAVSDAVTDAPGTFERTVRGVDRLYESRIGLRLNFVFCRTNFRDFPSYVRFVAERWPGTRLTVSFVAMSTDVVPRTTDLVPRYSDVLPAMADGVRLARELGLPLGGFESMCGLPLCLVPEVLDEYVGLAALTDGLDRGEFVKPDPCSRCALSDRCYGLRRGYRELHGDAELTPLAARA